MNIVLIGMSGAGKSTLGVLAAKALGMDFVDTDIVIQQREGRLLQEIIDSEGIERFLKTEEEIVSSLSFENSVVATGGSVVYSEKAMLALKREAVVIFVHAGFEEIQRRLTNIKTRGIVMRKGSTLRGVYEERLPLYKKYGDITVECTGRDIEECVSDIVSAVRSRNA